MMYDHAHCAHRCSDNRSHFNLFNTTTFFSLLFLFFSYRALQQNIIIARWQS
ncbi:MAG: hypothetical protein NTX86_03715 [Candidatus Dependentiae bacterium]|nr:hypothetical protein [Candidatus Dependentiae bacterium]